MKKTYSEDQLKEKANEVFAQHPTANTVHATVDGNVFLECNRATLHAGTGRVIAFHRPIESPATEDAGDTADKPLSATDAIKAINECTTPDELKAFEGDDRKTVAAAYAKKAAELASGSNADTNAGTGTTLTA